MSRIFVSISNWILWLFGFSQLHTRIGKHAVIMKVNSTREYLLQITYKHWHSGCQFHKHFTSSFSYESVLNRFWVLTVKFFGAKKLVQKLLWKCWLIWLQVSIWHKKVHIKCWWNWSQESILPNLFILLADNVSIFCHY